jgi:hypothetical protein
MNVPQAIGPVIAITSASLLVSCDGGNGGSCGSFGSYGSYGSYGSCGAAVADSAGIYEGSLSGSSTPQGEAVVTIIAESGDGRMSGANDTYYRLNVGAAGSSVNGTFVGYSQSASLPGGVQTISGTIMGTVTPTNLNATLTDPSSVQQRLALTFDNTYNLASSLTMLAGNWSSSVKGLTLTATIQPDGSFSGADSNNCTYAGSFGLIDPNFNTYSETHVRSCNGVNVTFSGLAAFFPGTGSGTSGTPTEIKVLSDSDGGEYLVAQLE